jgi:hypothetical protein
MSSVEHLMMQFTRLIERRAAGDDSPGLDKQIGWANSALLAAELRVEKAELSALPERTQEQELRLMAIGEALLSPEIQLHPSAYGTDRRFHPPRGRAIDLPLRQPAATSPWGRGGNHIHWAQPPTEER